MSYRLQDEFDRLRAELTEKRLCPDGAGSEADITPLRAELARLERVIVDLTFDNERRDAQIEQLHVQLAGCSTAALGATQPPNIATEGMYGWSVAYQDTLNLRLKYEAAQAQIDKLRAACEATLHEIGVPQPGYLAPVANAYAILTAALKGNLTLEEWAERRATRLGPHIVTGDGKETKP